MPHHLSHFLHSGTVVGPELGILAEMASLQMEYTMLAKATGKKRWWDRVRRAGSSLLAQMNLLHSRPILLFVL